MKNKLKTLLATTFASGLTVLAPTTASALNACIGCEYEGGPNSVGFSVLSFVPVEYKVCFPDPEWCFYEKTVTTVYKGRVILKQTSYEDAYQVLLRKDDTILSALEALQEVRPEATLEQLVHENKLRNGKLLEFKEGTVLTYTVAHTTPK